MSRMVTEWSTDDPTIANVLKGIASEQDPALRLDLEAALHLWEALDCTRKAERIRANRGRRTSRRP